MAFDKEKAAEALNVLFADASEERRVQAVSVMAAVLSGAPFVFGSEVDEGLSLVGGGSAATQRGLLQYLVIRAEETMREHIQKAVDESEAHQHG